VIFQWDEAGTTGTLSDDTGTWQGHATISNLSERFDGEPAEDFEHTGFANISRVDEEAGVEVTVKGRTPGLIRETVEKLVVGLA
jgi:hypothetical protein